MKQTKFILAGAVAALTLSSCSNNLDDNSSWGSDSQNVKFSSYIEGQKTVKASGTTWTTGDKVGIFMKKAGADLGAATAANKQFIADDRGTSPLLLPTRPSFTQKAPLTSLLTILTLLT